MPLSASDRFTRAVFADAGFDADVDSAFEDAVDTARVEYGLSGTVPSVASLSADDVATVEAVPTSLARATSLALRDLGAPNTAHARALAPDSQFKRRRLNVKIDDVTAPLSREGDLDLTDELEAWVLAQLPEDQALGAEEFIESVEVRTYRPRFKPQSVSHSGKSARTFVVTLAGGDGSILATGATAGEAKREAVALVRAGSVRAGSVHAQETYTLEVASLTRRDDGSPLVSVMREKVAQKATLRITLATPKVPEKTRTHGWLFYGNLVPAELDTSSDPDAPADPTE